MTRNNDLLEIFHSKGDPTTQPDLTAYEAFVLDTPTNATQPVRVRIPSFSETQLFGPCPWSPVILDATELAFPSEDDRALVLISEEKNPWIVQWWPDTVYAFDDNSVEDKIRIHGPPLFTSEGPSHYSAAYAHNNAFARGAPYKTNLDSRQENSFERWVDRYNIHFDYSSWPQDYDMRGFYLRHGGGPHHGHYPDTWKTPYDTSFSAESKYATHDCPFKWRGKKLVDMRNGQIIYR